MSANSMTANPMSANRRRGEICAELGGQASRLCLTLGALAELEAAYAADDLGALVERFSSGRLSARDMIRIVGAGLRGAGREIGDDQVAAMTCAGGATGFAAIVAELLSATFGTPQKGEVQKGPIQPNP
jgi:hypothetical protein